MALNIQTRWQAFGVHLLLSFAIFLAVSAIILLQWYPTYFRYFGGLLGVLLIAGVDLVLGPTLTLIVFDKAKKHLKWDLAFIGLVQIVALGYGTWSVYQGRPIAQVLTHEGVYIVTQADLRLYKIAKTEFTKFNHDLPVKVLLDLPTDPTEVQQVAFATEFVEGKPLALRTDLYKPLSQDEYPAIERLLSGHKRGPGENCIQVPILSDQDAKTACFHPHNGELDPKGH